MKGTNNTPTRTSGRNITNFDDKDQPVTSKDVTKKPTMKKKMTTFDDEDDDSDEDVEPIKTKSTKENKKLTTFDDDDDEGNFDFESVLLLLILMCSI